MTPSGASGTDKIDIVNDCHPIRRYFIIWEADLGMQISIVTLTAYLFNAMPLILHTSDLHKHYDTLQCKSISRRLTDYCIPVSLADGASFTKPQRDEDSLQSNARAQD